MPQDADGTLWDECCIRLGNLAVFSNLFDEPIIQLLDTKIPPMGGFTLLHSPLSGYRHGNIATGKEASPLGPTADHECGSFSNVC